MKTIWPFLVFYFFCTYSTTAQLNTGIHFQAIARNSNGILLADKQINVRLSILNDTNDINKPLYQEIKSVRTNVLGLFFVKIGEVEEGKIVSKDSFDLLEWDEKPKYIQVEVDAENDLRFISLGIKQLYAVPFAYYANHVKANNINGVISLANGGTGFTNLKDLKAALAIDKINNTPDSLKPTIKSTLNLINDKLNKIDTNSLSNRINLKLNKLDTLSLSNRINNLSSLIPGAASYGNFYDTAKQTGLANSATAVKWTYQIVSQSITITTNTSGALTRLTVNEAGVYTITFALQCVKADTGNDDISIWIRRNSSALPLTNQTFTIIGAGVKNHVKGTFLTEMGANDYVELFFSVKNANTSLVSTPSQTNPSRPATPSSLIFIQRIQ